MKFTSQHHFKCL